MSGPGADGADVIEAVRRRYRRFAEDEARGISPTYDAFTSAVADDDGVLRLLAPLPPDKQQPNLLLAAVRWCHGTLTDADAFLRTVRRDWAAIERVMRARRTQTNEPGRCATLLPVLAALPQPLALVEVGASAGLCLLPDRYRYRYGAHELDPAPLPAAAAGAPPTSRPVAPRFDCRTEGDVPLPRRLPTVVWRAGLDLAPVDVDDPEAVRWLEALVWPEQTDRLDHLRAALARADPPTVHRGDLRADLPSLLAQAPADATVVLFHSAVLAYLPSRRDIDAFASWAREQPVVWVSNEAAAVFPDAAATIGRAVTGRFVLSVDGAPVALTGPHGQSIEWLGAPGTAGIAPERRDAGPPPRSGGV
jgi:hypothetical protein